MKHIILPEDAPFSEAQREWLNGYLSALLAPYQDQDKALGIPVTIAWGSQTGTAESLAKKFSKQAAKSGITPTVVDLSKLEHNTLVKLEHLIIITSTYGDGEAPDNAQAFYDYLHSEEAAKIQNLNYAVLSLGDSSYPDFCQCGIDFDHRLKQLGATPIIPRVDMDADYDEDYEKWTNDILNIFGSYTPEDQSQKDLGPSKKNPYTASILNLYNLNHESSERKTIHAELSLDGSDISYEAGDALGVYPVNDSDLVDRIISQLNFSPESTVNDKTLAQALTEDYEIRNISLPLIKEWAKKTQSKTLKTLTESDDREPLSNYLWGLEIIDLLKEHPITFESHEDFIQLLKPLAPRLYSIASSPKAHPDEVHLTVGVVSYESNGIIRKGVCSSYFSERTALAKPRIFVHQNKAFRPPEDPTAPMIMVGPGTGIAPFRAFLEERSATQAPGQNWLFFGNPYEELDFLYQEQLEELSNSGYLHHLSLAFSRDQNEKIYVQDRMIEQGEQFYQWLENNGHVYVCGDASRMAKDVDTALHSIIATHGKMSNEAATQYVNELKASKRYCRDIY